MSQLVECVPNFSEGNNQEVRCREAGQGARGKGKGVCFVWGRGVSSLKWNHFLSSAQSEVPHERRDSERLARGEEEAAGCVVRQGSWPRVWAARLLKGPQTFSGGLCSYAHVT